MSSRVIGCPVRAFNGGAIAGRSAAMLYQVRGISDCGSRNLIWSFMTGLRVW
jgi:hypothetical protein